MSRGWLYTIGIVVNKAVPSWLFRFRLTRIYQLGFEGKTPPAVSVAAAQTDDDWKTAESIAKFSRPADTAMLVAFIGASDGQPVAAIWSAQTLFEEPELGLRYELADDDRWWFAARVRPDARGCGVYRSLLSSLLNAQQTQRHLVAINPTNRRSMAAHRRFLKNCLGTFATVRVLRWTLCVGSASLLNGRRWRLGPRVTLNVACVELGQ